MSEDGAVWLEEFMVPMRDGVRLATDVYLPANRSDAKLPALLCRTPYNKRGIRREGVTPAPFGIVEQARYYAAHGYAAVLQDVRGRYASEGTWTFLNDDADDGVDTCEWIAAQEWSDGQVGTFGTSYAGGTQDVIALAGAPELKTAIPVDAVSNMGRYGMRHAGAFELRFWNWVFTGGNDESWNGRGEHAAEALRQMSRDRREYLRQLPLRRGTTPLKHAPEYEDWLVSAMEHGADDGYWSTADILADPSRYQDIPLYLVGGWYDSWGGNTTANFVALTKALSSPVYLIMGPWIHGQQSAHAHGQVDFGPAAAIADPLAWRRAWFDRWLKDDPTAFEAHEHFGSRVRIFVMGTGDGHRTPEGRLFHGGYWRDEPAWPPARAEATRYYLHGEGLLSSEPPGEDTASTSYDFDPRDPVPSIGGNVSSADGILLQGGFDQRGGPHIWNWQTPVPISARNDVLVFQTEPLEEDVEVTGEIEVRLWVSSSAVDTDFTAKLIDVYPSSRDFPGGFDLNVEDGIVRMRFRDSLETEKPLWPGEVYEISMRLYPTSNVFKRGHRIRLDISSSNFPRFDVNPNTGEPLNRHRRSLVATNTVFHDRARPSHVVLPVIPAQ